MALPTATHLLATLTQVPDWARTFRALAHAALTRRPAMDDDHVRRLCVGGGRQLEAGP